MRYTPEQITSLQPDEVIVFGSNERGQHGGGLAKVAFTQWGAVWGRGEGHFGQSYALPTKSDPYQTLSLEAIRYYVGVFMQYATQNQHIIFLVTKVGCGLAKLNPSMIGPMFTGAPANVILPEEFHQAIAAADIPRTPKAMTYRDLKEKVNQLDDAQLDTDVIWWGEERGGVITDLVTLKEEYICTDEGYCPVNSFEPADLVDYEDEPRMPVGRPILHGD